MYCDRCEQNIPEFLIVNGDHPVIAQREMTIHRTDLLDSNLVRFTAEVDVLRFMCSELPRPAEKFETNEVRFLAEESPLNRQGLNNLGEKKE